MMDEGSKKFITIYIGITDGPFAYDEEHIAQLEYHSIPAIVTLHTSGARLFTPTFLHVLDFYQTHH